MAGFAVYVKTEGLEQALRKLDVLKGSAQTRVVRGALTKASVPVLDAMKAKCPTLHGNLKRALGRKTTKRRGGATVILGARRGFRKQIGSISRGLNKGKPIFEDPANIAHLVEFGHGGPHPAPPHPFARPAWDETKDEAMAIATRETEAGFAREVIKA